jgi:hypothetical protein
LNDQAGTDRVGLREKTRKLAPERNVSMYALAAVDVETGDSNAGKQPQSTSNALNKTDVCAIENTRKRAKAPREAARGSLRVIKRSPIES